jgi:hypothetical protein
LIEVEGITPFIDPEVGETIVPIVVGVLLKFPASSDNCAVKVFPVLKLPVIVKGILIVAPAQ